VKAWVATSKTRDFRQSKWESFETQRDGDAYAYDLSIPREGFAAVFAEATYPAEGFPYSFSTNVRIMQAAAK